MFIIITYLVFFNETVFNILFSGNAIFSTLPPEILFCHSSWG